MADALDLVLEPTASDPDGAWEGEATTSLQFVTFSVADETFAVPLKDVQEIIRLPDMVEVPMATASLKGLANLRGSVLPIISLRRIFAIDDVAYDDATRVVVLNTGMAAGFIVDRMSSVVTAEMREMETMDGVGATIDNELLDGVIKRDASMMLMLSTRKLMVALGSSDALTGGRGSPDEVGAAAAGGAAAAIMEEMQLVSFELDGQEYALPIETVQEIVQVPETVTKVSNAKSHILGVMNLRDRLLPLVSLRAMFGMAAASGPNEQRRIVVVTHVIDQIEHAVGLVTDTVKEVLRVPRSLVEPLPRLLSSGSECREVDQMCRMDAGQRLVSILLPERLFTNAVIRDALHEAASLDEEAEVTLKSTLTADVSDDEEQFVIFRVADEEYGVPIHAVQEIVRIPDQLTRVPNAPAFIEGVVNLRGAVLPVIDQRRRFGLSSIERNDRQRIMVFTLEGARTGFIVDSVSEVLKISRTQISPAPSIAIHIDSAVTSVANIVGVKRMILMLDVERLISISESDALGKLE